ncbi:MAG: hypothetical protein ABIO02_02050, partial [Patescibacteria group bacterium]
STCFFKDYLLILVLMKVLITGGAGFLGLHLAHYFEKKDIKLSLWILPIFQIMSIQKKFRWQKQISEMLKK